MGNFQKEFFYVSGCEYYKDNIYKLAVKNAEWSSTNATIKKHEKCDTEVYRYKFVNKPVKLVPEPSNQYDENAIMVMVAGELVGYISRNDNLHVLDILNNHNVKYISSFIGGGDFKVVREDNSVIRSSNDLFVKVQIAYDDSDVADRTFDPSYDALSKPAASTKVNLSGLAFFVLTVLLGWLGIHRFYAKKTASGVIWLFTLGICGLGWIIDIILVLLGKFTDKRGNTYPAPFKKS